MSLKSLFLIFILALCPSCFTLHVRAGDEDLLCKGNASIDLRQKAIINKATTSFVSRELKKKQSLLTSPMEHLNFMRHAIETATQRVIIVSPSVSSKCFLGEFGKWMAAAKESVQFTIYTKCKSYQNLLKLISEDHKFNEHFLTLQSMNNCNAILLIADEKIFANGSYNWLGGRKKSKEFNATTVVKGRAAKRLINKALTKLEAGLSAEKDFSLQAAMTVKIKELVEESSLKNSKSQQNLASDIEILISDENRRD